MEINLLVTYSVKFRKRTSQLDDSRVEGDNVCNYPVNKRFRNVLPQTKMKKNNENVAGC